MNTHASPSTVSIPVSRMRQLLDDGTAVALLSGHFPVPVSIDGQWWIVPAASTAHEFVPATPEQSTGFELAAQRLRAAKASGHPEQA
jgi:hypothetical protein